MVNRHTGAIMSFLGTEWDFQCIKENMSDEPWVPKTYYVLIYNILQQLESCPTIEGAVDYFNERIINSNLCLLLIKYLESSYFIPNYFKINKKHFINHNIVANMIKHDKVYNVLTLRDLCTLLSVSYSYMCQHPEVKKSLRYVKLKAPDATMVCQPAEMIYDVPIEYYLPGTTRISWFISGISL